MGAICLANFKNKMMEFGKSFSIYDLTLLRYTKTKKRQQLHITQHKRFVPYTALTQIFASQKLLLCWSR
jgi:hypothetical protein